MMGVCECISRATCPRFTQNASLNLKKWIHYSFSFRVLLVICLNFFVISYRVTEIAIGCYQIDDKEFRFNTYMTHAFYPVVVLCCMYFSVFIINYFGSKLHRHEFETFGYIRQICLHRKSTTFIKFLQANFVVACCVTVVSAWDPVSNADNPMSATQGLVMAAINIYMLSKKLWDKNKEVLHMTNAADNIHIKMKIFGDAAGVHARIFEGLLMYMTRNDTSTLQEFNLSNSEILLLLKAVADGGDNTTSTTTTGTTTTTGIGEGTDSDNNVSSSCIAVEVVKSPLYN